MPWYVSGAGSFQDPYVERFFRGGCVGETDTHVEIVKEMSALKPVFPPFDGPLCMTRSIFDRLKIDRSATVAKDVVFVRPFRHEGSLDELDDPAVPIDLDEWLEYCSRRWPAQPPAEPYVACQFPLLIHVLGITYEELVKSADRRPPADRLEALGMIRGFRGRLMSDAVFLELQKHLSSPPFEWRRLV